MCQKQTSISHSSTEAEIISLDAGLRMDEIPALDLWDWVIEVFHSQPNQANKARDLGELQGNLSHRTPPNMRSQNPTTHTNLDLTNIDHVPSSGTHSGSNALLYVSEDNEPTALLWIGCLTGLDLILKFRFDTLYQTSTRRHFVQRKFHTWRMEQSSWFVPHQSFQLSLLRSELQLDELPQNDGEKDAGTEGRRKNCGKIEVYSDELVFTSSGKFLICKKSDCIQKSWDTHGGETWEQDEKKFEIRRSVEFPSAAARCIPWRSDGHSQGVTCRNKRRVRRCGHFRIWNLEPRRGSDGETHCWKNSYGETQCIQKIRPLGKSRSWKNRMVTQSIRVSSHSSPFGSSLLDRQENLRTRTRSFYGWLGREHGHLGHISEYHSSSSSSSWTKLWGEFTIREESPLEQCGTVIQWN